MKKITALLSFFFFTNQTFAIPTSPVSHTHGERMHSHSLPVQGLAHRHGQGSLGVSINNSRSGNQINNGRARRPPPRDNLVISSTINHTPEQNTLSQNNKMKGDVRCKRGEPDCNVCASNVQSQFNKAASRKISWSTKPWRFNWPKQYAPYGLRPLDIFDGAPAYALGIPDTHIQGFVRTNSSRFPYAGTHSHKKRGGVFVIKQDRNGKKYLSSLHQSRNRHPSGAHIIGKYLLYGEGNFLVFKNINSPNQQQNIRLSIPRANFGGGLGITRLFNGTHLVITSGPGGQDKRPRVNRFYILKFLKSKPTSLRYIGESSSKMPSQWPKGFAFSENLSIVTECGTGDVYTIHTSGDQKGVSAISGNGYWRLSKLQRQNSKLSLRPISAFINRQNMPSCNVKASGSVHVNSKHNLEFYCHGYAKDPDGSLFNVLGKSSRKGDKFYFKVGVVK